MSVTDKTIIELSEQLQDMANQPTSVNDSVVYRLFDIMDKSLKRQKIDEKALENGAVYLVGTTGSGKSTLLNYLAGRDLKVINDKGKLKLVLMNPNDGLGSIGSGDGQSKTVYPLIYQDHRSGVVFIDNPGDQDSRGIAQEILHGYFKHNILQACPIIQILIVTSYHSLTEENGSAFVKYLKHFESSLEDSQRMKASISLVFTRVGSLVKVDDILSQLRDLLKNQSTNLGESSKILENIVNQQRIGLFMEPLNDQIEKRYQSPKQDNVGREEILTMLQSGTYALVPDDGLFRVTITETETIRMILTNHLLNAKSLSSFSSHIVNLIKTAFVQRISEFKDVETFLQMDENSIIKTGSTTNTDLKRFFQDQVNMDISQDYSLRKTEFFYRLLGKREFELLFGSINNQFNGLGIKQLYNSEPKLEYKSDNSQMILTGFNISAEMIQKGLSELKDKKLTQITIQAINMINFNEDLNFSEFQDHENVKVSIIAPIWNVTKDIHINLSGQDGEKHGEQNAGDETDGLPGNNGHNGQSFLGIGNKFVSQNITALLRGERITIVSDIRYSPKGADAIKFRKINLKFKLNSDQDKDFQDELARFNVELTSSGEYHYRYNGKYYNIPSISVSLSYSYSGDNGNNHYEKIANGDPIFSPYTTWTIKLTPIKDSPAPDDLYKKFCANIPQIELALEGEAQYIDMESYDGQASNDILVNDCYQDFVIKKFEIADI